MQVSIVLCSDRLELPKAPIRVPVELNSAGLSQVVSHLQEQQDGQYDFLINEKLLRQTLDSHIKKHQLSYESTLHVVVIDAIQVPKPSSACPHDDWVSSVGFVNDQLLTGSYDGNIRIWSDEGKELLRVVGTSSVKALAQFVGRNGDSFVVGAYMDRTLKLYGQFDNYASSVTFTGHTQSIECVDATQDLVISGSADNSVMLWKAFDSDQEHHDRGVKKARITDKNIKQTATLNGHSAPVVSVQLTDSIISASQDGTIRCWDLESRVQKTLLTTDYAVCSSHTRGSLIASGHSDMAIRIWDIRSTDSMLKMKLRSHKSWPSAVQWTSEHNLVSCSYDGTVKFWDIRSSSPLNTIAVSHEQQLFDVKSQNGLVITGGEDKMLHILK